MRFIQRHLAWTAALLTALALLAACGSSNNNHVNTASAPTSAGTTSAVSSSPPAASATAAASVISSPSAAGGAATEAPRTAGTSGTVRDFIAALDKGDFSGAQQYLASEFALTKANGQAAKGADVKAALQGLSTPIAIKSLVGQGGHKTEAMLQFGSGPVMKVEFTGSSTGNTGAMQGQIEAMKIESP